VAVFVGTRADLGPLSPVLAALDAAVDMDADVLTGVAFTSSDLESALPPSDTTWSGRIHCIAPPVHEVTPELMVSQGSVISGGTARVLRDIGAQVLVVLGDRWELLYVVPPAYLLGLPIVHLHGGEVTEGAIDERVRHAISKLADQHCVASADAGARLRQMGEPIERIHRTGAPGLDRLISGESLSDAELGVLIQAEVSRPVALFTYHPPTAQRGAPVGRWAREAAEATLNICGTVIGTYPGMDEGRDEIITSLRDLANGQPRFRFIEAFGRDYPRVLRSVDVVVGNSSSGIIEAATVHAPVVNVGARQQGRLHGDNVIDVAEGFDAVTRGLAEALTPGFAAQCTEVVNPYGAGDATTRILSVVRMAPASARAKPFIDPTVEST
jgi:UDP-N-acetylglucosamine 2-epimerase (non-hydrolysing)